MAGNWLGYRNWWWPMGEARREHLRMEGRIRDLLTERHNVRTEVVRLRKGLLGIAEAARVAGLTEIAGLVTQILEGGNGLV